MTMVVHANQQLPGMSLVSGSYTIRQVMRPSNDVGESVQPLWRRVKQLTATCHLPGRHVPFWRLIKSQARHIWALLSRQTASTAVLVLSERSVPAAFNATTEQFVSDPAGLNLRMSQRCLWHAVQPSCTAVASQKTLHFSEPMESRHRCARSQVQAKTDPRFSQELAMDTPEVQGCRLKGAGLP